MSMFKGAPKQEKQMQQQTWANLAGIGDTARTEAGQLGQSGQQAKGEATNFFSRLLKGDRTAVAPGVNAATAASDAQKREQATMGTARGGGAGAANQQRESGLRGQIMSLFGQQQEGAGKELSQIGQNDIGQMLTSLGLSGNVENSLSQTLGKDIQEKNAAAHSLWGSIIGGAAKLGMSALFPPAAPALLSTGGGGGDTLNV